MKQFLIIQLFFYFGWLSCIAVAQLEISSAITGSASFPHVGITCLGNLAVFITSFIRKRLDLEMAARDFLTITGPCKFKEIPEREQKEKVSCIRKLADFIPNFLRRRRLPDIEMGAGGLVTTSTTDIEMGAGGLVTTSTTACRFKENNKHELNAVTPLYAPQASVVMLSNSTGMTNSSVRQFMHYIYNAHDVHSALLKYDILNDSKDNRCAYKGHDCNCIKIREVEGINMPQVPQVTQVTEELTENESRVLLPCLQCLENECHGCKPDLLHVEEIDDSLKVEFSSAACYALDFEFTTPTQEEPICICIPVNDDKWTKLLVRFLKYKDQEDKGAIVAAADAVQSYLDNRGKDRAEEIGDETVSLIVIRLVEIFVNLLLTVFFKVDGFSSALAARRAVRSYVVDSKGNGLPANVFLTSALVVVKSDSVSQVLKFRGNRFFLLIVGCVNLLCAIAWAVVLIAFNGGVGKWYEVPSMEPSKPRVVVIITAIGIGIVMDFVGLKKSWTIKKENQNWKMILGVIILEIVLATTLIAVLCISKGIERWVYGVLQLLVWVKWGIGSSLLGAYSPEYVSTCSEPQMDNYGRLVLKYSPDKWVDTGTLVYSSSFLLNALMVGAMGDWAGIWSTWK